MPRVCFTLQVRPDGLDEYRRRHAAVWPEMLTALRDAGWRHYQLFLRGDGLLVGIVETDDSAGGLAAAQTAMNATDVSARWEAEMADFFVPTPRPPELPGGRDGRDKQELHLVFDLDAQLAAMASPPAQTTTAPIGEIP